MAERELSDQEKIGKLVDMINAEAKKPVAQIASAPLWSDVQGHVSSGSTLLDLAIQTDLVSEGGFSFGRITELFGEPADGKSTIVQTVIKNVIQMGGYAVIIESENRFDRTRAEFTIGIDLNKLIFLKAYTMEEGFDYIISTCENAVRAGMADQPLVIVWDTVSNTPTKAELEKGRWGGGMAERARLIRESMRKLTMPVSSVKAAVFFVNHAIQGIDRFSPPVESSGGGGIKHLASTRLWVKRGGYYMNTSFDPPKFEGIVCKVKIVKNTMDRPMREVSFPITFLHGIDDMISTFDFLEQMKFIQLGGSWYTIPYPEAKNAAIKFQGRHRIREAVEEYPGLPAFMRQKTIELWRENKL